MSDGRLRRFLHLERPRAAGETAPEDAPSPAPGRFDGVERPPAGSAAGSAAEAPSGVRLERFGPEPEPGIELLEADAGARPFTRCLRCGMDHGVFATTCTGCAASLDTPEQRAFNEDLWARRQAEAARDAEADRERVARRAENEAEETRARRELGETLAREVGRRERDRLDAADGTWGRAGGWGDGWGGEGGGGGFDAVPIGLRLLRLIPDARWRLAAGIGGGALALALLLAGLAGRRPALALGFLLLVVLVVPPGFRGRRRWW